MKQQWHHHSTRRQELLCCLFSFSFTFQIWPSSVVTPPCSTQRTSAISNTCLSNLPLGLPFLSDVHSNYLSDIVCTHTQCIFWVLCWLLISNSLKLIPWLPCTPLCNQFFSLMFLLVLMAQPFSLESSLAPSSSSAPTFNQLWSHQEFTYPPPGILSLLFPLLPLYW